MLGLVLGMQQQAAGSGAVGKRHSRLVEAAPTCEAEAAGKVRHRSHAATRARMLGTGAALVPCSWPLECFSGYFSTHPGAPWAGVASRCSNRLKGKMHNASCGARMSTHPLLAALRTPSATCMCPPPAAAALQHTRFLLAVIALV